MRRPARESLARFVRVLLLVSTLLSATTLASLPGPPAAPVAAGGNVQFDQYCSVCHGPDARGVANLGVDLAGSAFVARASQEQLVAFLRVGRLADDPASITGRPMPEFSWLAESELESIAAFLKSRNVASPSPAARARR